MSPKWSQMLQVVVRLEFIPGFIKGGEYSCTDHFLLRSGCLRDLL